VGCSIVSLVSPFSGSLAPTSCCSPAFVDWPPTAADSHQLGGHSPWSRASAGMLVLRCCTEKSPIAYEPCRSRCTPSGAVVKVLVYSCIACVRFCALNSTSGCWLCRGETARSECRFVTTALRVSHGHAPRRAVGSREKPLTRSTRTARRSSVPMLRQPLSCSEVASHSRRCFMRAVPRRILISTPPLTLSGYAPNGA